MQQLRLVYITCSNVEEARNIGSTLVRERLAACVNIFDGMESLYWWEGTVVSDNETVLLVKTIKSRVKGLTQRIKEIHSYDCPCVLTIAPQNAEGNEAYLNWLRKEASPV